MPSRRPVPGNNRPGYSSPKGKGGGGLVSRNQTSTTRNSPNRVRAIGASLNPGGRAARDLSARRRGVQNRSRYRGGNTTARQVRRGRAKKNLGF